MSATFDLSSVSVETAELPAQKRAGRHAGPNPFIETLAASYEDKQGRKVTVPGTAVGDVTYALRRAADSLGIGVRVVYTDAKGAEIKPAKNAKGEQQSALKRASAKTGNVVVLFQGKDRKKPRETAAATAETPAETPAAE